MKPRIVPCWVAYVVSVSISRRRFGKLSNARWAYGS